VGIRGSAEEVLGALTAQVSLPGATPLFALGVSELVQVVVGLRYGSQLLSLEDFPGSVESAAFSHTA
jgi:hypothetical protein